MKKHFRTIWPAHLTAFSRLLRQLREEFDQDLDQLLILAVIAERTPPSNWIQRMDATERPLLVGDLDHGQDATNMKSIADYTGIPRESVRRKVKVLERKGWISRLLNGNLTVNAKAAADLERATKQSIDYISAILAAGHAATAGRER